MGQGVWLDSDKLDWEDEVREVLKHGTLTVGFIGLAEALKALIGQHHGLSLIHITMCIRDSCEGADSEKVSNYIQNIDWKGDWYGQIYTSP